jgi:hypothetical protein
LERSTEKEMNKPWKYRGFGIVLSLLCLIAWTGQTAYGQSYRRYDQQVFNWGVRFSLNASAIMHYNGSVDGEELLNETYTNKTGYGFYTFFRVNLDRFFVQPEIGWSQINKELAFTFPPETINPPATKLAINLQTLNLNALVGYNITRTGPFVFNVITGASIRYKHNVHYDMNVQTDFQDSRNRYNPFGVIGFSTNISAVHFDVRYELSMWNTNIRFSDIPDSPDALQKVVIRKNENIISFSCGVMF